MSEKSKIQNPKSERLIRLDRIFSPLLIIVSSALLLASLKLPLWQMRLEAPQYRDQEALHIAVHPNALKGDLKELTVLNQYIGVHVPPTLPQFKWLPAVLASGAVAGLIIGFLPALLRRRGLIVLSTALATAMAIAAIQATTQIRDIGHIRDQKTILVGVKDFTPPFLGTSKIAQFTVTSRFGTGAWLAGSALLLQLGAAWFSRRNINSPLTEIENPAEIQPQKPRSPRNNPEGIAPSSPGLRGRQVQLGPSYAGFATSNVHNPERVAPLSSYSTNSDESYATDCAIHI